MKIRNDHIQALQDAEARKKARMSEDGFAALLDGELGKASEVSPAQVGQALQTGSIMGLEALGKVAETEAVTALSDTSNLAADQLEGMLSSLDQYGAQLASGSGSSLKEAYGLLENTARQLNAFRSAFPDLEEQQPELAAMVNELDVLTTTEFFKFNRGDYL